MMPRHAVIVLATVAALLGAPPTASAASNTLHTPVITPSTGTTGTTFVLRVTYEGQSPASAVIATVATASLTMSRISGSGEAGTWEVAAVGLPGGAWPVTFAAVVVRGNAPVLAGGTLTVADAATPMTSPTTPPNATPAGGPNKPNSGTPTSGPAPKASSGQDAPRDAPAAASQPGSTPKPLPQAAATAGGADASNAGAPAEREPAGADPTAEPAPSDREPASRPRSRPARGDDTAASPRAGHGDSTSASPIEDTAPSTASTASTAWVAWVAAWAAAVTAAAAVLFLVLARRRRGRAGDPASGVLAEDTAALLERRALRRARTVIEADPIVSSMGIDDTKASERGSDRRRRQRRDLP